MCYRPLFTLVSGSDGGALAAADLPGHTLVRQPHSAFPALVVRPGDVVSGLLANGLSAAQEMRLERHARVTGHVPAPVRLRTATGTVSATAWLLADDPAGPGLPWALPDWVRDHGDEALTAAAEVDWGAPGPDPAALAQQWPMVRMRAAATARARASVSPATVRHPAGPGDFDLVPAAPMTGEFFRLAPMRLSHRRFDGGRHDNLPREVFVGVDAALVLPYDRVRDRVLLVEQFRVGPARRGDPQPWTLEPVAGIVDAGETPLAAAHREAAEEACLRHVDLVPMFAVYASPGSATDYFHCFLGLADLPDDHPAAGGLASEAEDLRLHLVAFDRAMDLLDSGEVTAAPLAAMLLWLFRARPGLRAAG